MSAYHSLLLLLDGSPEAAKAAGCGLWLAEALGATLHVLHAGDQPLPKLDALARLHVPDVQRAQVVLHQNPENAEAAVLNTIATLDIDLVVMSARGESVSAGNRLPQQLGSVAQAVIERTPVPILLLPVRYREELPWKSILAAVSGEAAADRAFEVATQLAAGLGIKVTAVHVGDGPDDDGTLTLGRYADAVHHEYPYRVEDMVERGLALRTPEECECVGQVLLRQGEPSEVLLDQVAHHEASVLALGCHGAFAAGRARVFKRLVEQAQCALLLVRQAERTTARLKVGRAIDK